MKNKQYCSLFNSVILLVLLVLFSCKNETVPVKKPKQKLQKTKVETIEVVTKNEKKFENKEALEINQNALKEVEKGNNKQAKKLFLQALKADTNNAVVYNNLGLIASGEKNYPLAYTYFSKAIKKDPFYFNTYINYSSILLENNNVDKSIELNNHVIKNCKEKELIGICLILNANAYLKKSNCQQANFYMDKVPAYLSLEGTYGFKIEEINKLIQNCYEFYNKTNK